VLSLIISGAVSPPHTSSWHTEGHSTFAFILLPDSQERPLSEVTMQWMCVICCMKAVHDYAMDVCHLLYKSCTHFSFDTISRSVLEPSQTRIQQEQEKSFPGSEAPEVYS
jgi:hypothetical protein